MKSKTRKPINILKYLCISFGMLFLGGNLLFIKQDIYEIYQSVYGMGGVDGQRVSGDNIMEIPSVIQLPLAALNHETRLRRLMVQDNSQGNTATDIGISNNSGIYNKEVLSHTNSVLIDPDELLGILSHTSDCDSVTFNKDDHNFIAAGWTKAVYKGQIKDAEVAVKVIYDKGFDVSSCLTTSKGAISFDNQHRSCYRRATNKIMREIALLNGLNHPNIVQVKAHCVPDPKETLKSNTIYLATELGEPIDLIKLLQMTWEDRLRIAYGLTKLLHYLSTSPYGSVILNDLRRQQFVLVNGEIKLSDMDDAGFHDPICERDAECEKFFATSNFTLKTTCKDGQCYRFNEMMNIYNTGRHFTAVLLPYGCPRSLCPIVEAIVQSFNKVNTHTKQLLHSLASLVESYSNGDYLDRRPSTRIVTVYQEFLQRDLPGQHDYTCHHNVGPVCTVSVHDQYEAETMCDNDLQCAGFVVSQHQKSWTGRTLAHFKSNFSNPSFNANTQLYVKPGFVT